jgi:hypothetical protein
MPLNAEPPAGASAASAHPGEEIEYARQLPRRGHTLGRIAMNTAIPKTPLHRYLTDVDG